MGVDLAADLEASIDRGAGRRHSLTRQIAGAIRQRVQTGTLGLGERLPAVRALASALDVTPETVANAYRHLTTEGYLRGEVGRGTYVSAPPLRAEDDPLAPFGTALAAKSSQEGHGGGSGARSGWERDLLRLAMGADLVSFAASVAAAELAPIEAVRDAFARALEEEGADALQAGPTEGLPSLRQAIATRLLPQRGVRAAASQVCITSGSQQGIDLAAKVFVAPGDTVLVEQPSFLGALEAFRARGARLVGVPVDSQGIRVDLLASYAAQHRPRLLYCMPTYQNPTGYSLATERRAQVLRMAADLDLLVVEDDSAGFFHLEDAEAPPALAADDQSGRVILLGTFSKLVAAGVRLGWLVAANPVLGRLVAAKYASDLTTDALSQRAYARLVADGVIERHLQVARAAYRERRDAMLDALQTPGALPEGTTWTRPRGGFNVWIELPAEAPAVSDLYFAAIRRGVSFVPGAFFHADGTGAMAQGGRSLRLCYAGVPPEAIRRGVRLLGEALRATPGSMSRPRPAVY